jgi:hypothetical protein
MLPNRGSGTSNSRLYAPGILTQQTEQPNAQRNGQEEKFFFDSLGEVQIKYTE